MDSPCTRKRSLSPPTGLNSFAREYTKLSAEIAKLNDFPALLARSNVCVIQLQAKALRAQQERDSRKVDVQKEHADYEHITRSHSVRLVYKITGRGKTFGSKVQKERSEFEQAQMDVNDAERTLQTLNQQLTEAETARKENKIACDKREALVLALHALTQDAFDGPTPENTRDDELEQQVSADEQRSVRAQVALENTQTVVQHLNSAENSVSICISTLHKAQKQIGQSLNSDIRGLLAQAWNSIGEASQFIADAHHAGPGLRCASVSTFTAISLQDVVNAADHSAGIREAAWAAENDMKTIREELADEKIRLSRTEREAADARNSLRTHRQQLEELRDAMLAGLARAAGHNVVSLEDDMITPRPFMEGWLSEPGRPDAPPAYGPQHAHSCKSSIRDAKPRVAA